VVKLLAAVWLGAFCFAIARRVTGGGTVTRSHERAAMRQLMLGRGRGARHGAAGFQVWLSQVGAGVTPTQFWVVSAGVGVVAFGLFMVVSRTVVVAGHRTHTGRRNATSRRQRAARLGPTLCATSSVP